MVMGGMCKGSRDVRLGRKEGFPKSLMPRTAGRHSLLAGLGVTKASGLRLHVIHVGTAFVGGRGAVVLGSP